MKKFIAAFGFGFCVIILGGSLCFSAYCVVRTFMEIVDLTAWKAIFTFVVAIAMSATWFLTVSIFGAAILELQEHNRKKVKEEEDGRFR